MSCDNFLYSSTSISRIWLHQIPLYCTIPFVRYTVLYISFQVCTAETISFFVFSTFIQSFHYHEGSARTNMFIAFVPILVDIIHHIGWIKTIKVFVPFFLIAIGSTLLAWVSMVAFIRRKLVLWSDGDPEDEKTLLGRPQLYPAHLTHARFFPEKYHYWINYFLVGVPIGLRGRVGSVVSIESDQHIPVTNPIYAFLKRIFRIPLWFRIDTSWYLHRGDGHVTLAAKLERFLKERVC